jgi:hypothetical protein
MNHRETIHNIHNNYPLWKKRIELDYDLLGLSDDIFTSRIGYYFNSNGFGIILSKNVLIVLGKNKNKVRNEVKRLENKLNIS